MPATVGGVKAAVGAGTGLGEVFLIDSSLSSNAQAPAPVYVAYPCEGGMTEFLAHDEREWQLRQWLQREKKCGPGEFDCFWPPIARVNPSCAGGVDQQRAPQQ